MYGNGVAIGMAVIHRHHRPILPDRLQALTACSAEVVGATMRRTAVCRGATAATPPTASTATASASPFVLSLIKKPNSLKLKIRAKTQFPHRASGTARKGELLFFSDANDVRSTRKQSDMNNLVECVLGEEISTKSLQHCVRSTRKRSI